MYLFATKKNKNIIELVHSNEKDTFIMDKTSKEEGKYQESIQISTTPHLRHHMEKWQNHKETSHTGPIK